MDEEIKNIVEREKEKARENRDNLNDDESIGADQNEKLEKSALLKGAEARIPNLELFEEIITELENKRREIE